MTEKGTACEHSQLLGLRELSARIGSNSLLVQASTGNTSIKIDDELWIKASGKWLIDAYCDDFLIPVKLARAKRCLSENAAIPETGAPSGVGLRASIETAMHAVLPQKVVVHVHSVNTIAWAVRRGCASAAQYAALWNSVAMDSVRRLRCCFGEDHPGCSCFFSPA